MDERSRGPELASSLLGAWRTSCQVTESLVEGLPDGLWDAAIPGAPRRSFGAIAVHFHNSRARWIRTLGQEHGVSAPALLDPRRATRRQLLTALKASATGIERLLALGVSAGGRIPPSRGYVWRNLPLDVGHVLAYFVAHEGHHRGQLVLAARALDRRLPASVTNGLWQWSAFVRARTGPRGRRGSAHA
jgi:uncharacterized damage-inducible protein DinB